ncbi:MAG TPA: serine/threonine protein phosphatase [Cytophagales bacterium]|nr:serine/threonine protein phosphatase [Cytophagales bacterium]HAA22127.1 serine/threonine protein phosphatase [Cytophagales bacterium]HAP60819.1 serine/threonine protein phosphatase [Cytophagales bacterium]
MSRLVIPDIHGCPKSLEALLNVVAPTKQDTLYFLGDYIDRGPDSAGVLELIMRLRQEGYSLALLRGNHEQNFMKAFQDWAGEPGLFQRFVTRINKAANLLDEQGNPIQRYWEFMEGLAFFYQLPEAILVHAGLKFEENDPFADKTALLELRKMTYDGEKVGNRMIIHGHVPTGISEIEAAIDRKGPIIPLDNGCVFARMHKVLDHTQLGHLLCLDLDAWELYRVPNQDV